ncbi:hypothetical protein M427DRAFT_76162 [Gonapodya prolifera JEL478]|uniref:JmjC domain-containing protein n=1 Tax=Gonapodya prolifera (strain JEL478) TaxID=1344416 RepID=A0A138ZWN0_GONPJ|nr:hypothetical protein M427DRAFT_76162 [Gonapodya prolifera JEL478]|eukprot:KXS08906.1 hypothetical protein M427DRAFT_76162 [Gonapodya prolifera JEL478]
MLEWNDRFVQDAWHSRSPILFRNAVTKLGFDDDFLSMQAVLHADPHLGAEVFNRRTGLVKRNVRLSDYLNSHDEHEYARDISCPDSLRDQLMSKIPSAIRYHGANDIFSCIPQGLQVEKLMMYIGGHGSGTAGHVDACGTIAINMMTDGTHQSRALWIVVSDLEKAAEVWQRHGIYPVSCQQNLFTDSGVLPYAKAVENSAYIFLQRVGDMVILPGNAAHQVVNLGDTSLKVAWNVGTPATLDTFIRTIQPHYAAAGKTETYRSKYTALMATAAATKYRLKSLSDISFFAQASDFAPTYPEDLAVLIRLLDYIIQDEAVTVDATGYRKEVNARELLNEPISCNVCNCDIFNRAWICESCANPSFELCNSCRADGRSCVNQSHTLVPVQQYEMEDLYFLLRQACLAYELWTNQAIAGLWAQSNVLSSTTKAWMWHSKTRPSVSIANKDSVLDTRSKAKRRKVCVQPKPCEIHNGDSVEEVTQDRNCLATLYDLPSAWKCSQCRGKKGGFRCEFLGDKLYLISWRDGTTSYARDIIRVVTK